MSRRTHRLEYMQLSATVIKNSFPLEDIRPVRHPILVNDTGCALYQNTEPAINTHDEYRTREWIMKLVKVQLERKTSYETKITILQLNKTRVSLRESM